jgi:hypothetical protein
MFELRKKCLILEWVVIEFMALREPLAAAEVPVPLVEAPVCHRNGAGLDADVGFRRI